MKLVGPTVLYFMVDQLFKSWYLIKISHIKRLLKKMPKMRAKKSLAKKINSMKFKYHEQCSNIWLFSEIIEDLHKLSPEKKI